jgi:hypothetical protein
MNMSQGTFEHVRMLQASGMRGREKTLQKAVKRKVSRITSGAI